MTRKLNQTLGFYLPSFFRLHISTDNSIKDLNELSDFDFSVFFHEYVHFLQDVTTFYGLSKIHATVEYLRFANNFIVKSTEKEFVIPIEPDPTNSDNVLLNGHLCKITYGDIESMDVKVINRYSITNLPINIPNSPIPEIEVIDVEFTDSKGDQNIFTFGAGCIMENMAYLLEKLTCKDYAKSPDIPYTSAELLVKHIYPNFGKNPLNILALCDISLGISNPANYFILTIEEWKLRGEIPSSPRILYDNFRNGSFSINGSENNLTNNPLQDISNIAKSQLKGYFNDSYFDNLKFWIDDVISSAVTFRLSNPYFILDIAQGNIRENKSFIDLFSKIGTPLLTNNKNDFRFYQSKAYSSQIDIGYFWAINQIQNLFFGDKFECELLDFCNQIQSNTKTDKKCINEPWLRCTDKNLCPFALFWRHWGLSEYSPKMKVK